MNKKELDAKTAIDFMYDNLVKKHDLHLLPKNNRKRTKAQLFFVGTKKKELYVIVGDHVDAKSTRVLIEVPLSISLEGVYSDPDESPYQGSPVKGAAKERRITIRNQHTVFVASTDALARLLEWYSGAENFRQDLERNQVKESTLPAPDFSVSPLKRTDLEPDEIGVGASEPRDGYLALDSEQQKQSVDDHDIDLAGSTQNPIEEIQQRAIKTRRGQPDFRKRLIAAYRKCAVTGCAITSVLEAAHIIPHADETDWHVDNGLLLRADIHTLFDLRLLSVNSDYQIHVSNKLLGSEYESLKGQRINMPRNESDYPSQEKLDTHFDAFIQLNHGEQ
jgi:hypothetical protein